MGLRRRPAASVDGDFRGRARPAAAGGAKRAKRDPDPVNGDGDAEESGDDNAEEAGDGGLDRGDDAEVGSDADDDTLDSDDEADDADAALGRPGARALNAVAWGLGLSSANNAVVSAASQCTSGAAGPNLRP